MGLNVADIKVKTCQSADDVRALARAVLKRKRARGLVRRCVSINDQTPQTFQIPVEYPQIVFCGRGEDQAPTIAAIIDLVCLHYRVTKADLVSERRNKEIMVPRMVAYYLAATVTRHSFPVIGRQLGGRDHTTVLHGRNKIARKRETDPDFDSEIAVLLSLLGNPSTVDKSKLASWAAIPGVIDRLVFLVTQTRMPFARIASTLNREFGISVSEDACYGRAYRLGLKWEPRARGGTAPKIMEAA